MMVIGWGGMMGIAPHSNSHFTLHGDTELDHLYFLARYGFLYSKFIWSEKSCCNFCRVLWSESPVVIILYDIAFFKSRFLRGKEEY